MVRRYDRQRKNKFGNGGKNAGITQQRYKKRFISMAIILCFLAFPMKIPGSGKHFDLSKIRGYHM